MSNEVTAFYLHVHYAYNIEIDYSCTSDYGTGGGQYKNYIGWLDEDSDLDGLSDAEEATYYNNWYSGLDPYNWDYDGDQFSDGREIREGTNPTNPNSHPGYLFMFYIDTDNSLADVSLEEKIKDFAIYTYWDEFLQAYYSAGGG